MSSHALTPMHGRRRAPDTASGAKWSWRIARIAGIDLYIHATFPLLFAWVALNTHGRGATVQTVLATLVLMLVVFVIVVLHECGHALTARRFGIGTRDITLLPIGGIARLERMPRVPRQELLIALAGPAVNVVLAVVLYAGLTLAGDTTVRAELSRSATSLTLTSALAQLVVINVSLAAFNLIPAFPMDGGRVLRAILAMRSHDYAKATATGGSRRPRIRARVCGRRYLPARQPDPGARRSVRLDRGDERSHLGPNVRGARARAVVGGHDHRFSDARA